MQALPETTAGETWAAASTATCSPRIIHNAHQKGGAGSAFRRLPHGHSAHGAVHVNHVVEADFPTSLGSALTLLPVNWRGFVPRPFHSRSARGFLSRLSRSGSVRSLAQTRTYSARFDGSNRHCAQSLSHQQFIDALADGSHVSRLSSVVRLVGIDPNENGLTHAQIEIASGANSSD